MSTGREYLLLPLARRGEFISVRRTRFRCHDYIDVRVHWRNDADELLPTRKGVTIPIQDIPLLRAAIEAAEADGITQGLLEGMRLSHGSLSVPEVTS